MDLSGHLIIKKAKKLHSNKKYRIRAIIIIAFAAFFILKGCISSIRDTVVLNKKTTDGYIVKTTDKKNFVTALADRFLGKDVEAEIYCIEKGESYWTVGQKYGISVDTIIGSNPYLKNTLSSINEKLVVMNKGGVIHVVQEGENLNMLSKLYDIKKSKITDMNRVNIIKGIQEGDYIYIPDAKPKVLTQPMYDEFKKRGIFINPCGGKNVELSGRSFGMKMHPILKRMKFHAGIDIRAPRGTYICAAADGVVSATSSGGSYGKVVYIKHANGYTTRYAHMSRILTRTGREVKKGQLIGRVGNTGRSTSNHLHFEIRKNNKPINPLDYLW